MKRRARNRGIAALEFVMVLPLFLVVFLATMAVGQYLLMENELENATMVTAHRCVAYAATLRTQNVTCPAIGTISDELSRSYFGRACADVEATVRQVSLGDGQRFAFEIDASCQVAAGIDTLLSSDRFGVQLPRIVAHASAPLVIGP